MHVVALAANEIVSRFYGQAPRLRYFRGYPTGGQQALSEARRFPADLDGIIAGAPVSGGAFSLVWRIPPNAPGSLPTCAALRA